MKKFEFLCLILGLILSIQTVSAQTSTFTYQGRLIDGGLPATGQYDLTFKLYDQMVSGTQAGTDVVVEDVQVTAGIFTVTLDFGNQFPGANRFMEISVRPGASVGTFTILAPRQPLTSAPYSLKAANSTSADTLSAACVLCVTDAHIVSIDGSKVTGAVANAANATNAATATNALQLGGVAANQYVQTSDPRMTDARTPTAGSTNYVQNTTTPQATSNFNVSGNGTAGGTLSGNIVNTTTQYNIGGSRVLSVAGTNNVFAGVGAGNANTGAQNSFFGQSAGNVNTSGVSGSFFGQGAGVSNTTGVSNSFFGRGAGQGNTTGAGNSFFGSGAGQSNQTGSDNTIIGNDSDVDSEDLTFATAIGAGVVVSTSNTVMLGRTADTVQVPGAMNVTGALTANGSGLTNLNGANITNNTINASAFAADTFPNQRNLSLLGSLRWDLLGQRVTVGTNPVGVAFDGANIWVANINSANVTKLRASDGAPQGTFAVGTSPFGVAFDGANIWVTNISSNNVTKLRASDGAPQGTFAVGTRPFGVAFDGANIWVTNENSNNVTKLRASDGALQGTFAVGTNPVGVAFDGANIWVVNLGSNNVTKLRASDGAPQGTFAVGTNPFGVAFDGANIWVTNISSDTVTKLRASDGALQGTFAVGNSPAGVAFDGANIWVTNENSNNVTKLRASDGALQGTFAVGTNPRGVAFDGANMWVTNQSSDNVTKLPVFP